ncbi:translocase of the inner membrane [Ceratobasidium sp. 428]|nr:translocase of the inner membrane [Ceratobasidium sp. 395]KAG8753766.1 translocase of the inner membrane [Ceratobasidium sp. 428]
MVSSLQASKCPATANAIYLKPTIHETLGEDVLFTRVACGSTRIPNSPYRILNDTGDAFGTGLIGGAIWHGIKAARNSPKGHRFESMKTIIKARAPVIAGNFAAWWGLLSAFTCVAVHYRRVEDAWNPVFAGVATGGILAARGGPRAVVGSAAAGGVLLGVVQGLSVVSSRFFADVNRPVAPPRPSPPPTTSA